MGSIWGGEVLGELFFRKRHTKKKRERGGLSTLLYGRRVEGRRGAIGADAVRSRALRYMPRTVKRR